MNLGTQSRFFICTMLVLPTKPLITIIKKIGPAEAGPTARIRKTCETV
jgi:hypothetical protein